MNVERLIRQYLAGQYHLSLATCVENKPWVCEVHFVYDDDLNFYFLSKPSRRHSKEIAKNPNVAGNIVKQHSAKDKPRGVYFEGRAEMIDVPESHTAYKLYDERFGLGEGIRKEIKTDPAGHKFYKVIPAEFMIFDAVNFPDSPQKMWRSN